MTYEEKHRKARRKVRRMKGFYIHGATYVIMAVFFFLMNVFTSPFDLWFVFPVLAWTPFVALHYLIVFGIPGTDLLSKEWEERELEKQLYRLGAFEDQSYRSEYLTYDDLTDDEILELRSIRSRGRRSSAQDMV